MSRHARNKKVDAVVEFWRSLSPPERIEAMQEMLETLGMLDEGKKTAPKKPKVEGPVLAAAQ